MSIVVGVAPGHCSIAAVKLGVLLARSYEQELVVAAVNAAAWPPGRAIGSPDGEYQEFVARETRAALDIARAEVPDDLTAQFVVHEASSARRGLLEVCEEYAAMRIVVGAKGEAHDGETELGSVVMGLLQSASVPVAIAPHGFDPAPDARLQRATVAYSGSTTSGDLVLGAAAIAAEARWGIRIASFHTKPRAYASAGIGLHAEDAVIAEWERVIREYTDELLGDIEQFRQQPTSVEVAVGAGDDWHAALRALPWERAEVLLVGSSSLGPFARVSLGSHAVKIVRHSPVPVIVVPRRATEEYIAQVDEQLG